MTFKHKMHSVGSDGKIVSNSDINFYIDDVSYLLAHILSLIYASFNLLK